MRQLLLAVLLAGSASLVPAHAGLFDKKPEDAARAAVQAGMTAVTVWVDASWGLRNQGAANSLNESHRVFSQHGYKVVSVESYIENNDLQGFFVTYQKP